VVIVVYWDNMYQSQVSIENAKLFLLTILAKK